MTITDKTIAEATALPWVDNDTSIDAYDGPVVLDASMRPEDRALIVAAVNALPGLLARIAELEAEVERWRSRANMLAGDTQRLAMARDIANERIAERDAALRFWKQRYKESAT